MGTCVLESLVTAISFDKSPPKVQDHSELCTSLGHTEHTYDISDVHAKASAFMEGQNTEIPSFGANYFETTYKDYNLLLNIFQLRQQLRKV